MFSTISMFPSSLRPTRWLLTEEAVHVAELVAGRVVPEARPELPRLEVDDEAVLVAAGVVRHAGAAAAGPPGVAPGGAVHPPPATTALVAANPTILSRETADQVNLVCNELYNYQRSLYLKMLIDIDSYKHKIHACIGTYWRQSWVWQPAVHHLLLSGTWTSSSFLAKISSFSLKIELIDIMLLCVSQDNHPYTFAPIEVFSSAMPHANLFSCWFTCAWHPSSLSEWRSTCSRSSRTASNLFDILRSMKLKARVNSRRRLYA